MSDSQPPAEKIDSNRRGYSLRETFTVFRREVVASSTMTGICDNYLGAFAITAVLGYSRRLLAACFLSIWKSMPDVSWNLSPTYPNQCCSPAMGGLS